MLGARLPSYIQLLFLQLLPCSAFLASPEATYCDHCPMISSLELPLTLYPFHSLPTLIAPRHASQSKTLSERGQAGRAGRTERGTDADPTSKLAMGRQGVHRSLRARGLGITLVLYHHYV